MTAAYLSIASPEAHSVIQANLRREVRDNDPGMLRKFAIAGRAVPTDSDALAVYRSVESARQFVGQLSAVKIVLMTAFFVALVISEQHTPERSSHSQRAYRP